MAGRTVSRSVYKATPGSQPPVWPSWSYRPRASPGLALEIATDTGLDDNVAVHPGRSCLGGSRKVSTHAHDTIFTPKQMATLCVDRSTAWSGLPQRDDLTVIVVDVAA